MTQTPSDCGAQGSAQGSFPATVTDVEAPVSFEGEVMLRVLSRHGLSQAKLARSSGYSEGQVSRYLSGAIPAPVFVVRALLDLTHDSELLGLFATDAIDVVGVLRIDPVSDLQAAFMDQLKKTAKANETAAELFKRAPLPAAHRDQLKTSIDSAISALVAMRRLISTETGGRAA